MEDMKRVMEPRKMAMMGEHAQPVLNCLENNHSKQT